MSLWAIPYNDWRQRSDDESLAVDWQRVGDDMAKAIEGVAAEIRIQGLRHGPEWERELIGTLQSVGCSDTEIARRLRYAHFGGDFPR